MDFKDKLKYVRGVLFISQATLAKELKISFCTINRLENGKNLPNFLTQKRFENFCKNNNIEIKE